MPARVEGSLNDEWNIINEFADGEKFVQHPYYTEKFSGEFFRNANGDSFYEDFSVTQDFTERYHTTCKSSVMEGDESIAGSISSVCPLNDQVIEELDEFSCGKSPENDGSVQQSSSNGQLIFCELIEDDLTNKLPECAMTKPTDSEATCNTITSNPKAKVPEFNFTSIAPSIDVKKLESDYSDNHISTKPSLSVCPDLIAKFEVQKSKSLEGFSEWKTKVVDFHRENPGLMAQVFKVDLHSLKEGEYWFGPDFILNCNQHQAPIDSAFVRLITSEGCTGKKYLTAIGKQRVELKIGYFEQINNLLSIKVRDDGMLAMYDKTNPLYVKICSDPPDMFYDYNHDMVFVGIITPDEKIKVNIFGQDEVHDVDFYPNGCQVLYTDQLSKLQNVYKSRVVPLTIFSDNLALIDFNYSYTCNIRGKYQTKHIDLYIPAGANPCYF
ncbi:hypothetical protein HK103_006068 [Boothiomyces macroporosus]|uniref:Uncharacterized protein n=1 Tax=Boothiomyces macroporosus TaxID=261099 RepID=A0AAD5Y716_9FUNG|nr:hypothetical protein HK103_006068 [Boothiomyces macroporosus]